MSSSCVIYLRAALFCLTFCLVLWLSEQFRGWHGDPSWQLELSRLSTGFSRRHWWRQSQYLGRWGQKKSWQGCMNCMLLFCSPPVRWGLLDFMYDDLLPSFFLCLSLRLRRHLRRPFRQMSPDVLMSLQIAVGSAGPQQRAPDCRGQRRTSTGRGSGADWATPDINRGAL